MRAYVSLSQRSTADNFPEVFATPDAVARHNGYIDRYFIKNTSQPYVAELCITYTVHIKSKIY